MQLSVEPQPVEGQAIKDEIARFGADPTSVFASNLKEVRARIAAACHRSGRDPNDVRLLPITEPRPIFRNNGTATTPAASRTTAGPSVCPSPSVAIWSPCQDPFVMFH